MRPRTSTLTPIAIAIGVALLLALPAAAGASPYKPSGKRIYAGVSDTGSKDDYFAFTESVRRHVPIMQSFERWGGELAQAGQRWQSTETRGMLSISTSPCYQCPEVISPRRIARGYGDQYLIRLNRFLSERGAPTYIRLLPEMNGHWNPYAAFNEDGSGRGGDHKKKWFRRAWRRTVLIARGGRRPRVNRRLIKRGLPKLARGRKSQSPKRLGRPKVAFIWVPQTHGSPQIHANRPAAYWPGGHFVDWVGADIYAKFPNFEGLERLYGKRRGKPFMIGEWAPWDRDDPGFVDALHEWAESHKRTKMLVYYQGFGENNPFMVQRYPDSERALRRRLDNRRYKRYAPRSHHPEGESLPSGGSTAKR